MFSQDYIGTAKMVVSVIGILVAVLGGGWAAIKSFFSVYNTMRDTHKTVLLLATNHLPHIQESLNRQDVAIQQISDYGKEVNQNVKIVEVHLNDHVSRFEDTKKSVDRINDMFLVQAAEAIKKASVDAVVKEVIRSEEKQA